MLTASIPHYQEVGTEYSQTSLIQSSFIRIPRHPEENRWLPIYNICHANIQLCVFDYLVLSGIRIFLWKRMCAVMRGLTQYFESKLTLLTAFTSVWRAACTEKAVVQVVASSTVLAR